ncbi:uncharacterized protein [Euwallacea similis]|uniref:uncharacterized protein n=1 Tax=Euwallacea similis TaxID=1736056 RepID=UPI00344C03A6
MRCLRADVQVAAVALIWVLMNIAEAVRINRLNVPDLVDFGDEAILDCDFTVGATEHDLVVKWYFNGSQVYQWIPGARNPQSLGVLKGRVNLEPKPSADTYGVHRALHISKAGPDLSGNFTCSVSTLESEDEETKPMVVLVTEKFFELKLLRADEGYIRVQCRADGIFPLPVMTLHSKEREIPKAAVKSKQEGHLYEISAQVTLPELEAPEEFSCKLHIPHANYTRRRMTLFYPGMSNSARRTKWPTIYTLLLIYSSAVQWA